MVFMFSQNCHTIDDVPHLHSVIIYNSKYGFWTKLGLDLDCVGIRIRTHCNFFIFYTPKLNEIRQCLCFPVSYKHLDCQFFEMIVLKVKFENGLKKVKCSDVVWLKLKSDYKDVKC